MKKNNESGFSVVEVILLLVIVGIIGFFGWFVYNSNKKTNEALNNTNQAQSEPAKSTKTTKKTPSPPATQQSLAIKEWQVSIKLTAPIADANYHMLNNTAWLSTPELDKDPVCIKYYSSDRPSFAGIVRYSSSEQVHVLDNPKDGDNPMTAAQAAKLEPNGYKQIGDYVYYYEQGNGQPCSSETTEQVNAFSAAFGTLGTE